MYHEVEESRLHQWDRAVIVKSLIRGPEIESIFILPVAIYGWGARWARRRPPRLGQWLVEPARIFSGDGLNLLFQFRLALLVRGSRCHILDPSIFDQLRDIHLPTTKKGKGRRPLVSSITAPQSLAADGAIA